MEVNTYEILHTYEMKMLKVNIYVKVYIIVHFVHRSLTM